MTLLTGLPWTCWKSSRPSTRKSTWTWSTFFWPCEICAVSVGPGRAWKLGFRYCSIWAIISFQAWVGNINLSGSWAWKTSRAGLAIEDMPSFGVWIVWARRAWQWRDWSLTTRSVRTVMPGWAIYALWCICKTHLTRICSKWACKPCSCFGSNWTKIARRAPVDKAWTPSGAIITLGTNCTSRWFRCFSCIWPICTSRTRKFIRILGRFWTIVPSWANRSIVVYDPRASTIVARYAFDTVRGCLWSCK